MESFIPQTKGQQGANVAYRIKLVGINYSASGMIRKEYD